MAHEIESQDIRPTMPPPRANPAWNTTRTEEDETCCCPGGLCQCNLP